MTARQIWEGLLTELSKVNAPSMLLQDFNYFLNKAVYQYINKRYNIYDINQQTTDDVRVLKSTAVLDVSKLTDGDLASLADLGAGNSRIFGATYEVTLPLDYMHLLNCICIYEVNERYKCYNQGDVVQFPAKRLTADAWSIIVNDYYNRPLPERPYYYIHNINTSEELPTNPINSTVLDRTTSKGTDSIALPATPQSTLYTFFKQMQDHQGEDVNVYIDSNRKTFVKENVTYKPCLLNSSFSKVVNYVPVEAATTLPESLGTPNKVNVKDFLGSVKVHSLVEKEAGYRYGNSSNVRLQIRYGQDDTVFKLKKVLVDYIKTPQHIRLTQEQVNLTRDTSQIMEFPDYVCQEIINELTMLVMENTADPRLQTNTIVTQSIANPAQQQAPQQQPQQRG